MIAVAFQLHKVRRAIELQGKPLTVYRTEQDKFREPIGKAIPYIVIKGLYHETSGYISKMASNSASVKTSSSPMFLCLWEEAQNLLSTDTVQFNGKAYTVGGIKNLAECNLIADLSLEEVQ